MSLSHPYRSLLSAVAVPVVFCIASSSTSAQNPRNHHAQTNSHACPHDASRPASWSSSTPPKAESFRPGPRTLTGTSRYSRSPIARSLTGATTSTPWRSSTRSDGRHVDGLLRAGSATDAWSCSTGSRTHHPWHCGPHGHPRRCGAACIAPSVNDGAGAGKRSPRRAPQLGYCSLKTPAEPRTRNTPLPAYCKSIASYCLPLMDPPPPVEVLRIGVGVEV